MNIHENNGSDMEVDLGVFFSCWRSSIHHQILLRIYSYQCFIVDVL